MRKITAGYFHSLDGVVTDPDKWQFDSFDDDLGTMLGETMSRIDTVLLGRQGYTEWARYWPDAKADEGFASFINRVRKFVASRTLAPGDITWQNTRLIEGDVQAFARELKAGEGGDIAVMGGFSLTRQLFFGGLLEELTLITHPVVAGRGRRLFEAGDPVTRLELRDCRRTSRGNVVTTYGLRPE